MHNIVGIFNIISYFPRYDDHSSSQKKGKVDDPEKIKSYGHT